MGQPQGGNVLSVWARDKKVCHLCGWIVAVIDASRDHVEAKFHGGRDNADNYRLAHKDCNHARGAMPMDRVEEALALAREALGIPRLSHAQALNAIRAAAKQWHREQAAYGAFPVGPPRRPPHQRDAAFREQSKPSKAERLRERVEWDQEKGEWVAAEEYGEPTLSPRADERLRAANPYR